MSSPGCSTKVVLVYSLNVSPLNPRGRKTRGMWDQKSNVASELTPCWILSITRTISYKVERMLPIVLDIKAQLEMWLTKASCLERGVIMTVKIS